MRFVFFPFVLLGVMTLSSCSTKLGNKACDSSAESFFINCAEKVFEDSQWCSFHVKISDYLNGHLMALNGASVSYLHNNDESVLFLHLDDDYSYSKFNKSTVVTVDFANRDLLLFNKANSEQLYWMQRLNVESKIGYLPFFFQLVMSDLLPIETLSMYDYCDTVVRSVTCMVFTGNSPEYKSTNCVTGETRITQYECYYWVNKATSMLDSLVVYSNQSDECSVYVVESMRQNNMSLYYDSIFNYNARLDEGFTKMDENILSDEGSKTETFSTDWKKYPVITLQGDTISLSETEDWLLLNLWCFNCPTCIDELKEWGREKDSLGYRLLLKNGIKLFSLNYKSDNFDLLKQVASKTNSEDIICSSKGIDHYFQLPYLGYNYLISPSKEIVYQCSYVGHNGDYSEILEAKANYEKQHQIK